MIGFMPAVKMFYQRYVDFQGRSSRAEYWWFVLFQLIVFAVLTVLFFVFGGVGMLEGDEPSPLAFLPMGLGVLFLLANLIPSIALFIRRLHDIDQTGWIYLGIVIANFIPVVSLFAGIASIVIACIPGTNGPNKYGEDPYGNVATDIFA